MAKARHSRKAAGRSRLEGYRPILEKLFFILALLGVLTTAHLWIQESRGFDQGCWGFNPPAGAEASAFNCEAVVGSEAGTVFGISNVVLGLAFYVLLAALSAAVAFTGGDRQILIKRARAVLVTGGLLYSAYLVYYQTVAIGELCALCLTSATIVAVLFGLQLAYLYPPSKRSRASMQSRKLMREAGFFAALTVLTLLLVGADVAYFNSLGEPAVAGAAPEDPAAVPSAVEPGTQPVDVAQACFYDPEKQPVPNFSELVSFGDPMKGNPQAPVTVVEVFEPNCPHCKSLHPVMQDVIGRYGDRARFYIKPVVFWPERSLLQTEALYAAAQEGKFFEMLEHQFALQNPATGLSFDQLQRIAVDIGMNPETFATRVRSGLYRPLIQQQNQKLMGEAGIRSVPAVIINGRIVASSSRTVECLGELITEAARQQ